MPLYCMDFRDYTTLRNTRDKLNQSADALFMLPKGEKTGHLDWSASRMKEAANNLDIVIENLYAKGCNGIK